MKTEDRGIRGPIEKTHPADALFGEMELDSRQKELLNSLPETGSRVIVDKKAVSMLDLSAMTAKTGDEFAMFTRKGKRLIVRGDAKNVPLFANDIQQLGINGYRWSGHTHAGFMDADLIASQGDKDTLELLPQANSAIYNASGKYSLIYPKGVIIND